MAKKIALGKGLASLIQETPNEPPSKESKEDSDYNIDKNSKSERTETPQNGVMQISLTEIHRNPKQPRKIFRRKRA